MCSSIHLPSWGRSSAHPHGVTMRRFLPEMSSALLLLLLSLLAGKYVSASPGRLLSQLRPLSLSQRLDSLLTGHSREYRPVRDWRTVTVVSIDFSVQAVLDVEEKHEKLILYLLYRQRWQDEYLRWDPDHYQGVKRLSLPLEELWIPDITVYETVAEDNAPSVRVVYVSHCGLVEYRRPMQITSSCPLDLFHFPLDTQTCNLTFGTLAAHTKRDVKVRLTDQFEEFWRNWDFSALKGEWELLSISVADSQQPLYNHHSSAVRVQVTVRRRPLFYMVNLILPSALLLLLDVLGYLIPPYYKQRLSYKSTTFTGYFIFILMVFSLFPPFRGSLPLIEVYLIGSLGLLLCSVMETVMMFQLSNGRSEWARKYLFPFLSKVLGRIERDETRNKGKYLPEEGSVANSLDGSEAESAAWTGKGGEELRALGEMKREVERMRRWLHSLRQERESQCVRRELVTLLDLLYLFLHCLTLLLGTVLFCMLWNMRL
ncbi:5-hydroxytryptamine receptor 3A-like [Huso huso]|uniref:5-hydroxytryptamine receptor 3A-like n=1 Tax=Huso huso TaxID=61971 RepID=A0ABR1A8I1_HUSHU